MQRTGRSAAGAGERYPDDDQSGLHREKRAQTAAGHLVVVRDQECGAAGRAGGVRRDGCARVGAGRGWTARPTRPGSTGVRNASVPTTARSLYGPRMLTVTGGEGHGVLYARDSSPCADKAVTVCLTTGRLPAKDLTCQPPARRK
ncbi:alpha/beta hydrolase [Streptomyces sp. NPDC018059]|uniref:alpha/beta hydrolase n=1 Tax=Streptomyces sp. NPDC018059 TaxID=3365041 RepID=UPI003797EA69